MEYKQVILVRQDLKMPKGKLAAQVAHASVEATLKSGKDKVHTWRYEGMKKVVLKVSSLTMLKKYVANADMNGLTTSIITDQGKTFFKTATTTCAAIGPEKTEDIDEITNSLKMM